MIAWLIAATLLAAPYDGWSNLRHVTRDRLYAVVLRDGHCQYGILSSVGERGLVLATDSQLGILLRRSQVLRVSNNLAAPGRDVIFSARSSWLDVQTTALKGNEYLRIVTKRGGEWKWKQPVISGDSIASEGVAVGKREIRYVFYVRSKPLGVDEEYYHQEDFKWLASIPLLANLVPPKINVLLYNSGLPEDNSPLACRLPWHPAQ